MARPKVHILVEALTEYEVKQVKLILTTYKPSKLILELFNHFLTTSESKELTGRSGLSETIQKYYNSYCNKLYDVIMPVLRVIHDHDEIDRRTLNDLIEISILLEKKIYDDALHRMIKVNSEIQKHELEHLAPSLMSLYSTYLLKNFRKPVMLPDLLSELRIDETTDFNKQFLLFRLKQGELTMLNNSRANAYKITAKEEVKFKSIIRHAIEADPSPYRIVEIERMRLLSSYYLYTDQFKDGLECLFELKAQHELKNFNSLPEMESYWACLINILQVMIFVKNTNQIEDVETAIKACISDFRERMDPIAYDFKVCTSYSCLLSLHTSFGNISKAKTYLDPFIEVNERIELKDRTAWLHMNLAYFYFVSEAFEDALTHINKGYAVIQNEQKHPFFYSLKFFEIFVHSELHDVELTASLIRSHSRGKWNRVKNESLEKFIYAVLKINAASTKLNESEIKKIRLILKEVSKIPDSNYHEQIDIKSWIGSKVEGTSYAAMLRRSFEVINE